MKNKILSSTSAFILLAGFMFGIVLKTSSIFKGILSQSLVPTTVFLQDLVVEPLAIGISLLAVYHFTAYSLRRFVLTSNSGV